MAWNLFPPDARAAYRDALGVDDAEWERGKGWVVTGLFGILSYRETNPVLAADKRHAIEALLADRGSGSTPRNGAGSMATVPALRPIPASFWAMRPPKECPTTTGCSSN